MLDNMTSYIQEILTEVVFKKVIPSLVGMAIGWLCTHSGSFSAWGITISIQAPILSAKLGAVATMALVFLAHYLVHLQQSKVVPSSVAVTSK